MRCSNCGSDDIEIINKVKTSGSSYSASMGLCGALFLGPSGLLCGLCGDDKKTYSTAYWVCKDCGRKWKT